MKIKVCGMREADNIRAVDALGVDYMGFIFYPRSSRYISEIPAFMPEGAERVGVFVDASPADIIDRISSYGLHIVQLHGHESPQRCQELRMSADGLFCERIRIWKAISIDSIGDLQDCGKYVQCVDGFVFDTKCSSYGGSGSKYDWNVLSAYTFPLPFLLSGGIGPDDADKIRSFHHPAFMGIDLNSRFESAPAVKDIEKLNTFIKRIQ
ncbi:MAG: phosphoribosylanthranilate isomerase [Bacteroidaceae bacterium]|nr:phosphoribosylanthranilate isomerase [Bacteroidaceae bacterium]